LVFPVSLKIIKYDQNATRKAIQPIILRGNPNIEGETRREGSNKRQTNFLWRNPHCVVDSHKPIVKNKNALGSTINIILKVYGL
jgi:hypothetical protein